MFSTNKILTGLLICLISAVSLLAQSIRLEGYQDDNGHAGLAELIVP